MEFTWKLALKLPLCYNAFMKKIVLSFAKTGDFIPENIPMSPARSRKLASIQNADARALYAASSAAINAIPGLNALSFRYGENGRPCVDGGCVSPAHTGGMAVCAYCDVPVGCDIEKADRPLSKAMQFRFGTVDDWLALEACVKLTGEGLSGIKKYRRRGDIMTDNNGSFIAYVKLIRHGEYSLAVCCGEEFEIEIIE